MTKGLTAISLFSGCGGSDLGAKHAGVDVVLANDSNIHAAATYRKYRELIASTEVDLRAGDVRDIASFPKCDLLIGCYPCQSFTMGGPRDPASDDRTLLYQEFQRCLRQAKPKYFVAENVAGLKWLHDGVYLEEQLDSFARAANGYRVSLKLLDAKEFGIPADRKRIFMVGVRKDLLAWYRFPDETHGPKSKGRQPYVSHGDALKLLPAGNASDIYRGGREPFSWWYMSRNRKRPWHLPAYTVVANWRHATLHPASPKMRLVSSDLRNGSKQLWKFTHDYDVPEGLPRLEEARRLSWRECSALQSFPIDFEPVGPTEAKYWQIGNAVPPLLMQRIVEGLVTGKALTDERPNYAVGSRFQRPAA